MTAILKVCSTHVQFCMRRPTAGLTVTPNVVVFHRCLTDIGPYVPYILLCSPGFIYVKIQLLSMECIGDKMQSHGFVPQKHAYQSFLYIQC